MSTCGVLWGCDVGGSIVVVLFTAFLSDCPRSRVNFFLIFLGLNKALPDKTSNILIVLLSSSVTCSSPLLEIGDIQHGDLVKLSFSYYDFSYEDRNVSWYESYRFTPSVLDHSICELSQIMHGHTDYITIPRRGLPVQKH